MSGNLVARYFERVLGARAVSGAISDTFSNLGHALEVGSPRVRTAPKPVCLLIEVGSASRQPSLQQMGARLVEALRNEWLKKSIEALPEIEWLQVEVNDWEAAIRDRGLDPVLAIVCGAQSSPEARTGSMTVLHVPSFAEMNASPVVKRDAWRAIQEAIASTTDRNRIAGR